jgi:hydroxypyruvate isomerase
VTILPGRELCKAVGSENFKLLYDIYHMQSMEGDVIHTIKDNHQYIAHLSYRGVLAAMRLTKVRIILSAHMKAIVDTGYKGFVGQEFIPKREDKRASLNKR